MILTLFLINTLMLACGIQPVKAFGMVYINNLTMTVTPESPTIDDNVYVAVSFTTASISYIVSFSAVRFDGIDHFYISIRIVIPEVVTPENGYAEKTFDLGKLAKGAYIFDAGIIVYNFEGKELFRTWRDTSFAVGAVKLSTIAAPHIIDDSLVPGSIFRINITVGDVEKLLGYEFALWYDTDVLTAIDYWAYPPFTVPLPSEINEPAGYVMITFLTFWGDKEGISIFDPRPVAWIDFYVDNIGASILDFSYFSMLVNTSAREIPHEEVDGFFDNRPPIERTQQLIEVIETWNLPKGTKNSLASKLQEALHLLEKRYENGATHKLMDFIDQAEALRNKKLTSEQADNLIAEAQRIINLIEG